MKLLNWPVDLRIYITFRCNQTCQHCYTNSCPTTKDTLISIEIAKKAIKYIARQDQCRLVLDGGEPALEIETTEKIIDYAIQCNIPFVIRTNGLLLTYSTLMHKITKYKNSMIEISTGSHMDSNPNRLAKKLEKYKEKNDHFTIVKYDKVGKNTSWPDNFKIQEPYICGFGRGKSLDIKYQEKKLENIPACKSLGHSISLFPDGTLWGCAGYYIHEMWKNKLFEYPLYWGTLVDENIEDIIGSARKDVSLRLIRTVGHFGAMCINSEHKNTGNILSPPQKTNARLKFKHICDACRWTFEEKQLSSLVKDNAVEAEVQRQLVSASELRESLFP